jgi:hypothetical protein
MTRRVKVKELGIPDIVRALDTNPMAIYNDAKDRGRSLSRFLDQLNPTESGDKSGLDAFGRIMKEIDIVSRTDRTAGIYADTYEDFVSAPGGRALFPEWCWRQYRRAQQLPQTRVVLSSDAVLGSLARPYVDDLTLRGDDFQPVIPVSELLAGERGIEGNSFRASYLTEPTAASKRFVRIGEDAEIPKVKVMVGERQIDMYKFGRGIEWTYEAARRETLDRVARMVQLMAVQAEIDKLSVVIDVAINGDGNSGTAATNYNLSTLDAAATLPNPTVKGYLGFRGKWSSPYRMTHLLGTEATILALELLNMGSANFMMSVLPVELRGTLVPIDRTADAVRYGRTADIPANKWLGLDARTAVERVFEIGADIRENERYVSRQAEAVFSTEVEGYMVVSDEAAKTLNLNA